MSTELSSCGCCKEIVNAGTVYNVPGLSAIAYRIGTHAAFKSSMLKEISKKQSLAKLTTRDDDDPTIALMDSWAIVLDVLSFYQERIANEGYLRTATERQSVLEMARAIGYELSPGVAAETYLAFYIETTVGSPDSAVIGIGTKTQSVPGQDETPQVFETIEEIQAYRNWNEIKAKSAELWKPVINNYDVYLKGTATNLKIGDGILIIGDERDDNVGSENWDFRNIIKIETVTDTDSEKSYTKLKVDRKLGSFFPRVVYPAASNPKVFAMRQRANIFGYNAPDWKAMPDTIKKGYTGLTGNFPSQWPDFNIAYSDTVPVDLDTIYLDSLYSQFVKNSWIVISKPASDNEKEYKEVFKIDEVSEESLTNFTISSKCSKLKLSGENLAEKFKKGLRKIIVYGQSEELEIAEEPYSEPVEGDSMTLETIISGLYEDQNLVVSGTEYGTDTTVKEVVSVKRTEDTDENTIVYFNSSLIYKYEPASAVINANVAKATHGESKEEILGSGDGSKTFQEFALKYIPLTYTSSSLSGGSATTLKVLVNDIQWEEVSSFYNTGAAEKVYTTRLADDGTVTVRFGDGVNGSRLPTGVENIKAKYRTGIGLNGLVKKEQVSLLMTRPLGVKSVINPFAPSGAANPQTLDEARDNAPLTVLTMDRIVSLQDYEYFARAFAGIGKAMAASIWLGENRFVHLTVSGVGGSAVDIGSELYNNLVAGIDNARCPDVPVKVDNYKQLLFNIEAKVYISSIYNADMVLETLNELLLETFSFDNRYFGQTVAMSEMASVIQSVEGVIYTDIEFLYIESRTKKLNSRLFAKSTRLENNSIEPAELILINPDGIVLTGISQ